MLNMNTVSNKEFHIYRHSSSIGFELQTAEVAEQGVLEEVKLHMEETFWL